MTPAEAARALLQRRSIRGSLEAWCEYALAPLGQKPALHHKLIICELERIALGPTHSIGTDRLMIMMPPGSAKSEYASRLFPAWIFCNQPGLSYIGASHTADLAERFSWRVQNLVRENSEVLGFGLKTENRALWDTTNGCQYRAVGVGGAVTGFRCDIATIDDPIKGRAEADSLTYRDNVWDWYRAELLTRLKPHGRIVLILTKWHEDDLAGRILKAEPDRWRVLRLPALAEPGDLLGRAEGEALWPEWESREAILDKKRVIGSREFSSLFQQRPTAEEGSIIKRPWWRPWTDPKPERPDLILLSLDTAFGTKESNDYSACTVFNLLTPQSIARPGQTFDPEEWRARVLLRYAWQARLEFPALIERILETADHFKVRGSPIRVLVEGKANGISVIQELRRRAPSLSVFQTNPRYDKVSRAHSVTPLFEAGKIWAMATEERGAPMWRPWAEMVINQAASFPLGENDDLVDSLVQGVRHMRDLGAEFFGEDEPPIPDDYETRELALY